MTTTKIKSLVKILSLLVILLAFSDHLHSKETVIKGNAGDYAGKEITFYKYNEPILHKKQELATAKVDGNGKFTLSLNIEETTEVYSDLEKYRGTMVVEPGKSYTIALPPYSPRTLNEARSAFFEPTLFWLGIEGINSKDINLDTRAFITAFNGKTARHTNEIYLQQSKESVLKIIDLLEQKFPDKTETYFNTLKNYYYAGLEYTVNQKTPEVVIKKYFAQKPVKLSHPVYQRVFIDLFTDYLSKQAKDIRKEKIITFVNTGNYSGLVTFYIEQGFSREFAEVVVIKGLYDGYYSGTFTKEGVIKALEKAQAETSVIALKPVVGQVVQKLLTLKTGGKAPAFSLKNRNGEMVTPDKYKGRFVYLVFFQSNSPESRTELDSIVPIEKKLRQVLSVLTISVDDKFTNAEKLWQEKKYPWELLNGAKQKKLMEDYNVRVSPTFYLIAPDGTFQLAQAPPPSKEFEALFLKIFRDYNFKHPQTNPKP